jgi:hypothetical protein
MLTHFSEESDASICRVEYGGKRIARCQIPEDINLVSHRLDKYLLVAVHQVRIDE